MATPNRKEAEQDLLGNLTGKKHERYQALLERRDQLVDQIKSLSESSLVSTKQAGEELADVGSDDFMREVELSLMGTEEKEFILIQEAIERLIDGSYGTCVDCGGNIANERLDAIAYAKLCIDCKEAREENNGMPPEETVAPEKASQLVE